MSDAKYFSSASKKGEISELRADLNSLSETTKKDAVKKVIALMTVGKDVSKLFADVLKCITTSNLELKKLVYLYVMNYAKSNEEMAILVVNTLQQDCSDRNPLVRALALRTMGCIRVEKILEYFCDPLAAALKDQHPYVVKTAALCVAKLYNLSPELVENKGFLDDLKGLLADTNPLVVANAVAALIEIDEISPEPVFTMNRQTLSKLITGLEDCPEWGQCFLLNSISKYNPKDAKEAKIIIDKVVPQLQHMNSAVVLNSIRIVMKFIDHLDKDQQKVVIKKLQPPLVSLFSRPMPEIHYVALKNIWMMLQKRNDLLQDEFEVFFCKYNDPLYVKMEKLDILVLLINDANIDAVLLEFKEYAMNVDIEFVRKVIKTIGRTAIKIERAADKCVQLLLSLLQQDSAQTKEKTHQLQESIIVLKDVLRRYPLQYEHVVNGLIQNVDFLDEPEAMAAIVWIIGEFTHKIENPVAIMERFVTGFKEEPAEVQQQILTAAMKIFLKKTKNAEAKAMLETVLDVATKEVDNADVRDRGFIYLRLLTKTPEVAKQVVLSARPHVKDNSGKISDDVLNELIGNMSSLASVYHKPPANFVPKMRVRAAPVPRKTKAAAEGNSTSSASSTTPTTTNEPAQQPVSNGGFVDLGLPSSNQQAPSPFSSLPPLMGTPNTNTSPLGTFTSQPITSASPFGNFPGQPQQQANNHREKPVMRNILDPNGAGKGLQVDGMFVMHEDHVKFRIIFSNQSQTTLETFKVKLNTNIYDASLVVSKLAIKPIPPSGQSKASVTLKFGGNPSATAVDHISTDIEFGLKTELGIAVCICPLYFSTTFTRQGQITKDEFAAGWRNMGDESSYELRNPVREVDEIKSRLAEHNVFVIGQKHKNEGKQTFLYTSAKMADGTAVLMEIEVSQQGVRLCSKIGVPFFLPLLQSSIESILAS